MIWLKGGNGRVGELRVALNIDGGVCGGVAVGWFASVVVVCGDGTLGSWVRIFDGCNWGKMELERQSG